MQRWKRTFWTVWWANALTALGMMSFLPFFPGHLERMGLVDRAEIAAWAGAIFGAAPLAAALSSPVWGAIGDRFGRRLMVVRAMLGITVFVGAMAFATEPWQLLVLRLGQGCVSGFVAPSQTLVSVGAPPGVQGRVSGSLQMAMALGAIFGPTVGGLVAPRLGLEWVFGGVAVASAACALAVWALAHEEVGTRRAREDEGRALGRVLRGALGDLRSVWENRRVRTGLVLLFWVQFGLGATNPLLELFVADLGVGGGAAAAARTGPLFSAMALANLVAMPWWGRYGDRIGHRRALVRCALATCAALVLQGLAPGYLWLLAGRVLVGAAMAGAAPCAFGLAAAEISIDRRGGAFGVVFGARALAVAVSATIGGWASEHLGIRGLFLVGAALVLVSAERAARAGRDGDHRTADGGLSAGGARGAGGAGSVGPGARGEPERDAEEAQPGRSEGPTATPRAEPAERAGLS